ncbi:GL19865 [Drosophila persimilis]|uniref:GL19865 n=1 Tax=Drosophila persimilis TaxID=7234 RepID=B4IRC1_DROPE|nr:GL19865 [Drosophila persimilis]
MEGGGCAVRVPQPAYQRFSQPEWFLFIPVPPSAWALVDRKAKRRPGTGADGVLGLGLTASCDWG